MRILATTDAVTASWQSSLDLARGLSRLGHETVLALTGPAASAEQIAAAMRIAGLRVVDAGLEIQEGDEVSLRAVAAAISSLADETGADIVQLGLPALAALADFEMPVVAMLSSCPATWWEAVRGGEPPAFVARRIAQVRAGLLSADAVVTPTAAFAEAAKRRYGLGSTPHCVHPGRSPLAIAAGVPHDFVFTAGPLWDEGENLALLDAAAGRIGVPMRAAGPLAGPDRAPVLFDNIHCLGNLGDAELGRWLSARPVFVSASLHEPVGAAILEAASAGCALILSDIPSLRELWDEVALFADPRDEDAFTRAIAELVGDDFERAVLGRAARERAARYTPDAMAAQMASLYRSLLPAIHRPVLAAARAA